MPCKRKLKKRNKPYKKQSVVAKPIINTVDGVKKYYATIVGQEIPSRYSVRNGYWVIHQGDNHHIYR